MRPTLLTLNPIATPTVHWPPRDSRPARLRRSARRPARTAQTAAQSSFGSVVVRTGKPQRAQLADPMFEPTDRDGSGAHAETAALDEWQLHPAGDDGARKMAMPHEHHVTRRHQLQRQSDGPVRALADLRHGFAVRAAVSPDRPTGMGFVNLRARHALVGAVIPLGEQLGLFVDDQAGQFGGLHRTPARAADHLRIVKAQVGQYRTGGY